MSSQSFIALAQNIALLLAVALLFDLSTSHRKLGQARLEQLILGILIGAAGLVIMSTPWKLIPGVVFDTRSVLLGISGLFFGTLPTVVAAGMTSSFRLFQGGTGTWTGISVILASGATGILWRHLRLKKQLTVSWGELLLFGLTVHAVMLGLMLTLPKAIAWEVLKRITIPVLLIYPAGTASLGMLLARRLRREETADQIRESEERYKALYNSIVDPILMTDSDTGIIIECNSNASEKLFGRPCSGIVGRHLASLQQLGETPPDAIPHPFENHLEHPELRQEVKLLRPDGSVVLAEVRGHRFHLQGKNLILSIFHDVTEARKYEQTLRHSESRHRALVSNFPGGAVFLFDRDLRYELVGGQALENLGLKPAQMEGKTIREVFPEQADTIEPHARSVFDGNNIYHELEFEGRFFANYGVPLFDDQGQVVQGAVMAMDITDQKKAGIALKENEMRFRELLDNVEMISVQGYDENRRVTYWNQASEKLYGWTRQEALGRKLEDLIIPDFMREDVIHAIEKWMRDGVRIPSGELELHDKNGDPVPVYSSHTLREDVDGKREMFCMDVDLADIKHVHQELLKAKDAAEEASRIKSEFLANMSHEIRTPLNGILGMLQLLEIISSDEQQKEYILTASQSARRLTSLLSDILDLSKVEANRLSIQSASLNIAEVVAQSCELFQPTACQTQIELICRVDPAIPYNLRGDAARLQQILTNIIGNAFKFTKEGRILVEVSSLTAYVPDTSRVLFSISDTGIGIPEDKINRLFQPFTQVNTGYRRDYQGAGLGLSICKKLIELMGGNIAMESQPEKGTTIHFCLAFSQEKTIPPSQPAFPDSSPCGLLRILLAEDENVNRLATMKLLQIQGHAVTSVEHGQAAIAQLRERVFDIVLMDIQMPVMDGLEATKAIRSGDAGLENKRIPIIAMTAYAMEGDREKCLAAGMDGYVPKPMEMVALQKELNAILGMNKV